MDDEVKVCADKIAEITLIDSESSLKIAHFVTTAIKDLACSPQGFAEPIELEKIFPQ